jgi:hypothetical protein
MEDKNVFLTDEIMAKFNLQAEYMLVRCEKCAHKWGINFVENKASPKDLVCRHCSAIAILSTLK